MYSFSGKILSLSVLMIILFLNHDDFKNSHIGNLTFYVSKDGNDYWSGKLEKPNYTKTDGPFKTIKRAIKAVSNVKMKGEAPDSIFVYISSGKYYINSPLTFTRYKKNQLNYPVKFSSLDDKKVHVVGGKEISGFRMVKTGNPHMLKNIPDTSHDHVMYIKLKQHGIKNLGNLMPRGFGKINSTSGLELFYQSKPMQIARWPNKGWEIIPTSTIDSSRFSYQSNRPNRWVNSENLWLHGFWSKDWADSYVNVSHIDTLNKKFVTEKPYGVYGYEEEGRYYALNLLEELDRPGEWYLDRSSSILYFWPPYNSKKPTVTVSIFDYILKFHNASNIEFDNFVFEVSRKTILDIKNSNEITIRNSVIRNSGGNGINIYKGHNVTIENSSIYNTGGSGIRLVGGNRETLQPSQHKITGCKIYKFGRWDWTYHPGIQMIGVGHLVSGNEIYNAPHSAIILKGNDNVIINNNIHHVCKMTDDAGAFYMGRDWTMRGNILSGNYFHNIKTSIDSKFGVRAIYLDDLASGTLIQNNIISGVDYGLMIGGGRDNYVLNNIFHKSDIAIYMDARGLSKNKSNLAKRGGSWKMFEKLERMNYKNPPYSDRYPSLRKMLDDNPLEPASNVIENNAFVDNDKNIVRRHKFFPEYNQNYRFDNIIELVQSDSFPRSFYDNNNIYNILDSLLLIR